MTSPEFQVSTYQINPDQNNRFEIFRENFGDPNLVNLRMEYQQHYSNKIYLSKNRTEKALSRNQLYYFVIRKTDMNFHFTKISKNEKMALAFA